MSASGTDPNKKDPLKDDGNDGKKEKKQEEKKEEEVKKVSPVARFFSSMKVKFTVIIIFYTLLSIVVGCAGALFACLDLYEKTDILSMKEMVQSIVGGLQIASNAMIQRGGYGNKQFGDAFEKNFTIMSDPVQTEIIIAKYIHDRMAGTTDASGLYDWKFMPFNLIMMWDENWTERLVYYRPCKDMSNLRQCELTSREVMFEDYANGDYRLKQSIKDQVPDIFKNIKTIQPKKCLQYGDCVGIVDIPHTHGGPMMYFLSKLPIHVPQIPIQFRDPAWHVLWATEMAFFNQIAANRSGLCVSGYSSTETDLPEKVEKEYHKKVDNGQLINPHDSYYNNTIFSATFFQDTDVVTEEQEFYATTRYEDSDRQYCDDTYDHGPEKPRSKSTVYLAYNFDDFVERKLTDDAYMIRLDFHNPISQRSFTPFHAAIVSTSTAWFVAVCILVIYFNCSFLVPLEKMRKMRSELVKTSLAGLDDDGTLAKEIFGYMVDDNALIDANGDEIRVMLTLQSRLDGFYTGLIKTRSDELAHIKAYYLRRYNAMRIMNYFMRRDDEDLQKSLPGLLDSKELNRHFRRTAVGGNMADGLFLHDLMNARHSFRQFKAILNNELAIEFFKSFCLQRGRSTVNSLFFVMDVSWLNQVEEAAKKGTDDFLSGLFAETLSQSSNPPSVSVNSPELSRKRPEALVLSTGSLSSLGDPELCSPRSDLGSPHGAVLSPRGEAARPRHSHFAKKDTSSSDLKKSQPVETEKEKETSSKMKVPFAKSADSKQNQSSSLSSLPSECGDMAPQQKLVQSGPAFASTSGDSIARFIYESYFGRRSLAQRDMKHAALLGCSQIPDYLALRDAGDNVVYSPIMFNNLLAAVVKKISNDVIPQFMESTTFQIMVYCLILTNFFTKSANKGKRQRSLDDEVIARRSNVLVSGIWQACHVTKQQVDDEDESSSSDDSDDDDDDEKEEEKGGESPEVKTKEGDAEDKQ